MTEIGLSSSALVLIANTLRATDNEVSEIFKRDMMASFQLNLVGRRITNKRAD